VTEPRGAATAGVAQAVGGRLVGSISESDLRRITPGHFDVLAMVGF
jgi:CBS domain-containing protein